MNSEGFSGVVLGFSKDVGDFSWILKVLISYPRLSYHVTAFQHQDHFGDGIGQNVEGTTVLKIRYRLKHPLHK